MRAAVVFVVLGCIVLVVALASASDSDSLVAPSETSDAIDSDPPATASDAPPPVLPGEADYHSGMQALYNGEPQSAVGLLQASADAGYAGAMTVLAVLHSHGLGVPKDEARAVVLHTFAALSGGLESALALSYRHQFGIGVPRSCPTAARHAKAAADAAAAHLIDSIHSKPRIDNIETEAEGGAPSPSGTTADSDLLNLHYFKAEKGDTASTLFIGYAHMLGLAGVAQDVHVALRYFHAALKAGEAAAYGALGQVYVKGVRTAVPPILPDPVKAREYFEKGALAGHPVSLNGMGFIHAVGNGVPRDFAKAATYFERSASQENQEGLYNLGVLFLHGRGVARNVENAASLFTRAANGGNVLAHWQLGTLQLQGLAGGPRDCHAALRHFRAVGERGPWLQRLPAAKDAYHAGEYTKALVEYLIAGEAGSTTAVSNAAFLVRRGLGLESLAEASAASSATESSDSGNALPALRDRVLFSLVARMAGGGSADAHLRLGDHYYYGVGTPTDLAKAEAHYVAAAERRHARALYNLGLLHQRRDAPGLKQDFHLAKRCFDQALEIDPTAAVAVNLALVALNFRWWFEHYSGLPGGFGSVPRLSLASVLASVPHAPFGMAWDDALLVGAGGLVLVLLLLRHHAVVVHQ